MKAVDQAELSRALFGRAGRLRTARWILENVEPDGYFFASELQSAIHDVPEEVKANLLKFQELGIVLKAHRDPGHGRRQYYQRANSPIWGIFEQALRLTNGARRRGRRPA